MKRITVDGNTAAANVAYMLSDLALIYPITPSSTMAEKCDEYAANGKKNIFDNVVKVVEMQSEAGSSGAMHGAISGGALTTTFTSSQGLLLMIPNMYKIAGELKPNVIHVSARTIASHALSIFGDHQDVMAVRQTGYALINSTSVQEAQDIALITHLSTLDSSVPFVHFFDGFRTSHEINTITPLDFEKVKQIYPFDKLYNFRQSGLSSHSPYAQGTTQNSDIFFQNREASNTYYNNLPQIIQNNMDKVYSITKRKYDLFEYYGDKNAEQVIVIMGSGYNSVKVAVDYINNNTDKKVGVLLVRVYRPFSTSHFINSLPKSVKQIAVLDRTKECGAIGEPLYLDVVSAISNSPFNNVKIIGGRYGIASKEFTPSMAVCVYEFLNSSKCHHNFTVGINDDVTNLSIPYNNINFTQNCISCKFYGYGGDGTVSSNKNSIKIITQDDKYQGQAYFEYDSKKSGSLTVSHLRFSKEQVNLPYLIDDVDFVSINNQTYLTKYNFTSGMKENSNLLINTNYNQQQLESILPKNIIDDIINKKINVYTIDAYKIAKQINLGRKINLIMQSAFFKLANILDYKLAVQKMKEFAELSYGSKGKDVVEKNYNAIDSIKDYLQKITFTNSTQCTPSKCQSCSHTMCSYYKNYIEPINNQLGNNLSVSQFDAQGKVPTGTTQYEKRGIATNLPCWNSKNCIQCNMCAFACPHGCIRPYLVEDGQIADCPTDFQHLPAQLEQGKQFVLQLNPQDCTGCGVCQSVCPAINKALTMVDAPTIFEKEKINYNYIQTKPHLQSSIFKDNTVKGVSFKQPYFEFSSACAGCGETPYLRLLSQLFGKNTIIANATGCSSIYGGSSPTIPYTKDQDGKGIAWANSLFEDNAEFGYGISLATTYQQQQFKELIKTNSDKKLNAIINDYLQSEDYNNQLQNANKLFEVIENKKSKTEFDNQILSYKNFITDQNIWIVGGDGWAYDIGYNGIDHILASGKNVNILVLDTEVYSNTGGQTSKSTPLGATAKFSHLGNERSKKDLAMIATMYKNVYVAKVAMGANMNQTLTAFKQAQAHNGVSIIIAYAPCIEHGIDMSQSQLEMKKAVESGYFNLWRYNPEHILQNKNPFIIDSQPPTLDYIDFIKGENRYKKLIRLDDEKAKILFDKAKQQAKENYEYLLKLSQM